MESLRNLIPLVIFLLFPSLVITQNNSSWGYGAVERDALYSLKSNFYHTFLTKNWTGLPCDNSPQWFGVGCTNGRVTELLLPDMSLTGKVNLHAFVNLTDLSILSLKNNSFSGNIMDFTFNTKLKRIDLSDNMFYGPISILLLGLDMLESLQLQGNKLTGSIPEFDQQSLKEFNVSHNKFYGEIPQTEILQSFTMSSYFDNPGLCGKPSLNYCDDFIANDESSTPSDKKKALGVATLIAIFVVLDIIGLVIVILLFYLYYKKSQSKEKDVKVNEVELIQNENLPKRETTRQAAAKESERKLTFLSETEQFELNDLFKASAEGLGKGNFGNVYKAKLDIGPSVVVKQLRDLRPLSDEEFADQMRALADLKHPNLLPPLAYYYSKDEKLVVHKFMQNGNLFSRLFGRRGHNRVPFKWNSRLNVAQSVARAMEFLHVNKSDTSIPHGNLKSSNILLDANEMAIVSDYGLASLIASSISSQRMTAYKCPEYRTRKKLSRKADVWCYGVLILELLTGKISTCSAPPGVNGVDLCTWVHRAVREEWTAEIFDIEISRQRNASDGMLRLLQIAMKCCEKSPEKRLDMAEVVRRIEEIKICDSEEEYSSEISSTDFRLRKKEITETPAS